MVLLDLVILFVVTLKLVILNVVILNLVTLILVILIVVILIAGTFLWETGPKASFHHLNSTDTASPSLVAQPRNRKQRNAIRFLSQRKIMMKFNQSNL